MCKLTCTYKRVQVASQHSLLAMLKKSDKKENHFRQLKLLGMKTVGVFSVY